ncbi:uncharacterized protein [Rutidosis leptorrhynchoides]|uniref:uncharacterized protein n=1 Tax=Rutidosis leptorrhynchoides TaxID=125765 RepID=UPI003A999356
MSAETKVVFDQLTKDAMKLMEDGDYNVYDEKQEVFQREAEGFEKLGRARGEGTSSSTGNMRPDSSVTSDFALNRTHATDHTSNNENYLDMFADSEDEKTSGNESDGRYFFFLLLFWGGVGKDGFVLLVSVLVIIESGCVIIHLSFAMPVLSLVERTSFCVGEKDYLYLIEKLLFFSLVKQ